MKKKRFHSPQVGSVKRSFFSQGLQFWRHFSEQRNTVASHDFIDERVKKSGAYSIIRVAGVAVLAAARVVSRVVAAQGVHSAGVGQQALVDI